MLMIDDFVSAATSRLGTTWRCVTDSVMGGVSEGRIDATVLDGRRCLRLNGSVSLENNGGFVQMALDLTADGGGLDASAYRGVQAVVRGNGAVYGVHLRTTTLERPWQSYRAVFAAPDRWTEVTIPFSSFEPHRTRTPFDPERLRRIGFVAIGRAFTAELAVAEVAFYP